MSKYLNFCERDSVLCLKVHTRFIEYPKKTPSKYPNPEDNKKFKFMEFKRIKKERTQ